MAKTISSVRRRNLVELARTVNVNLLKLIGVGIYAAIVFIAVGRVVALYVIDCKWQKKCPEGGFKMRKSVESDPA